MELWCPFAIAYPGPASKVGAGGQIAAPKRGVVMHSAEGYWDGIHSVLADQGVQSSWHFTVGDERIEQHYPLDAVTWHANDTDIDGLVKGNNALVGIEHIGVAGEALTERQIQHTLMLNRWLAAQVGRPFFGRYPAQFGLWTMAEHNEIGNDATACPSGRIPWEVIMSELHAAPHFAYGNQDNGCELRPHQQVFWVNGVEVLSIGDPEGAGLGRLAKNFADTWYWLRKGREGDINAAWWSTQEGD